MKIKPYNIIDNAELPEMMVDRIPVGGDPLEINEEMYYVCEENNQMKDGTKTIGVIPLVIKDSAKIENIESYLRCLSCALRRNQYLNGNNNSDFID